VPIYQTYETAPLPNGWRLSCGAERERSQTEFYDTET